MGRRACLTGPALLALALGACVQTGDLGRPKRSDWSESAALATGSILAQARGEPVSAFILTDDEGELRDRAWRFLTPAHERAFFERILSELTRTRILPASAHPADPSAYHRTLLSEDRRSPHSAYRRLSEDVAADGRLVTPVAAAAARVLAADRVRIQSLRHVQELAHGEAANAAARVAENLCLIAWIDHEALLRVRSYRYALEHLVVEAPQAEAVRVERSLAWLGAQLEPLRALASSLPADAPCSGALATAAIVVETVVVREPRPGLIVK